MITLQETIRVPRPIADCFRYLADFSTSEQWDPGVYRASKLTPGEPKPGSEFDLILNSAGRRVPMRYTVTALDAPLRIDLQGQGDGFSAHDVIRLRSVGPDSTDIEYHAELRFQGPAGHVEKLLNPLMVRMGKRAVNGLQQALTRQTEIQRPGLADRLGHALLLPAALRFTEHGYLAMANKGLSDSVGGKTAVITGATTGLGLAAACELSRLGASVVLVGRDSLKVARAARSVREFSGAATDKVSTCEAELSSLAEVKRVGAELANRYPRIDILINNAGALFAEHGLTADGHERALAINLLCPWLLTNLLLPSLSQARGRVINVSSGGMYLQPLKLGDMQFANEPYDGSKAYARAKRALVAVTEYWAQQNPQIFFSSMHPGWAATPGVAKSLPAFNRRMQGWLRDSRMGADTMVWLASSQAPIGHSGKFWFDRQPRPTSVLPGTAVSKDQCSTLLQWLESNT
ncbi:SDR family NAD(P)-dependent oxidoreductase [Alcanivorax sp. 1008]|uniref:SDR family NAD(P)-dependent oxidoreductase n=1 Tax=Alcanivorax sp. 1008 TaxID=2816853 RepID=UPI001DD3B037|nr:SDR family NAD(P)-dependent oxidoreductase [Alcanivorax sp. 1008]MCC1495907.1 SDR family NAD(P)-dependent oxidoreductase [Alcanivorax sp. 1008]